MVTILAFVVLGGGAAFAATKLGKNSVGTAQLRNGAVDGLEGQGRNLASRRLASGQLPVGQNGAQGATEPLVPRAKWGLPV